MITVGIRSKFFGATQVLGDISFTVAAGETVAVLGPSGVGKSTLLRIVAGIDTDFDGRVDRPEKMAIVFQEPTLLRWRSVLDNLMVVHPGLGRDRAMAALERVGLASKGADFPGQLSLGQQRRLALARAFMGRPEGLIMDEAFVSLDPALAKTMFDLTRSLIAETQPATLLVTHDIAEAEALATRILSLSGSPATLSEHTSA